MEEQGMRKTKRLGKWFGKWVGEQLGEWVEEHFREYLGKHLREHVGEYFGAHLGKCFGERMFQVNVALILKFQKITKGASSENFINVTKVFSSTIFITHYFIIIK